MSGELCISHRHELEEHGKHGHEAYRFHPIVLRNESRQAKIGERFVGRGEEVDECRGDDDAAAEISRREEYPRTYSGTLMACCCVYREQRSE